MIVRRRPIPGHPPPDSPALPTTDRARLRAALVLLFLTVVIAGFIPLTNTVWRGIQIGVMVVLLVTAGVLLGMITNVRTHGSRRRRRAASHPADGDHDDDALWLPSRDDDLP